MRLKVLVKGGGEHASGTAHRLFRAGCRVLMTELARPTAIRRSVAFGSAVYEGVVEVEGVRGVLCRVDDVDALPAGEWPHVPVCVDPASRLVRAWRPDVVVDARLLKLNLDNALADAPLVIGLGPGLVAGRDVHYAIETMRGHDLGRIVAEGPVSHDTGEPGDIGGHTTRRLLRSPADGVFTSARRIGDRLAAGDVVAHVGEAELRTPIAGVLRGLLWPGLEVTAGFKVGDVDPRNDPGLCRTLSDKTRTISGSVLELVAAHAGRSRRGAA